MDPGRLVLATRNRHKLHEFEQILSGVELVPLPDDVELPPEDGDTFEANALGKARAARASTGEPCFADDSGICAAALGGAPGVRSARFAGPDATDEENLSLLLTEMESAVDRTVAYVCAIAYIDPAGAEWVFEGICEGTLAREPRGGGGFGYDPAFIPREIPGDRTMGELEPAAKHAISHRGRAAALLAHHLGLSAP